MNHPRYPEYKDSGVDWLGLVPSHWVVTALKHGYSVTLGKMLQPDAASEDDALLPYLRAANIQWAGVDCTDVKSMWFSKRDREQLRLEAGDLLVSEGGDVGRSAIWTGDIEECYFQNSVNRVRPLAGNLTTFLAYWMSTMKDKGFIDVLCNKSTIAHFTAEKVGSVPVPFPPRGEQLAIAAFLDHETTKIDTLVEEQKRLIELLKEKRQVVISQAVTKGLDPNVPMKDSGNKWIGRVPMHWTLMRLKHARAHGKNAFVDGPFGSNLKSEHFVDDGDVYVIESVFATQGILETGDLKTISAEHFATINRSETRGGDIIIAKIGAQFGKSSILPVLDKPAVVSGNSLKLTVNANAFDVNFVNWHLVNLKAIGVMDDIVNATAQPALSLGEMNNLPLVGPPLEEQQAIVSFLDSRLGDLDGLMREAQRGIELLLERRSALISAAVTGKIDVRGLALQPEGATA